MSPPRFFLSLCIYFYAHAKLCQKCATDVSRRYIRIDCKITWQYYSLLQNVITLSLSRSLFLSLSLERGGKSAQQLSTRRRRRQWRCRRRRWRRLLQSQEVSAPDNKSSENPSRSLSLHHHHLHHTQSPPIPRCCRRGRNLLHEPRVFAYCLCRSCCCCFAFMQFYILFGKLHRLHTHTHT